MENHTDLIYTLLPVLQVRKPTHREVKEPFGQNQGKDGLAPGCLASYLLLCEIALPLLSVAMLKCSSLGCFLSLSSTIETPQRKKTNNLSCFLWSTWTSFPGSQMSAIKHRLNQTPSLGIR